MSLANDRYTYRITWSEDDQEYVGLCAEFPSLSWLARRPEGALQGIRKAVEEAVIDMRNNNEPTAAAPISSRPFSGKFVRQGPAGSPSGTGHEGRRGGRQPQPLGQR